jgi:hypothetical protein
MRIKEILSRNKSLWIALIGWPVLTSAAADTNVLKVELHISGAVHADRILSAAIDDHHFCKKLTRGWTHSISHGPVMPGDEKYFKVPIYHVAFNQQAPHLRVGLNDHPGFSLNIDNYDSKVREYDGNTDKNTVSFDLALDGKQYNGYRGDPDSPDYNPKFYYHLTLDPDRQGGRFTASHLVENNGDAVINVTGNWHCQRSK